MFFSFFPFVARIEVILEWFHWSQTISRGNKEMGIWYMHRLISSNFLWFHNRFRANLVIRLWNITVLQFATTMSENWIKIDIKSREKKRGSLVYNITNSTSINSTFSTWVMGNKFPYIFFFVQHSYKWLHGRWFRFYSGLIVQLETPEPFLRWLFVRLKITLVHQLETLNMTAHIGQ